MKVQKLQMQVRLMRFRVSFRVRVRVRIRVRISHMFNMSSLLLKRWRQWMLQMSA